MPKNPTIQQSSNRTILFIVFLLLAAAAGLYLLGSGLLSQEEAVPVLAQGGPRTLVFQNGVEIEGYIYQGTEDVYPNAHRPNENSGSLETLLVTAEYGGIKSFIRFDMSSLPTDAEILQATLSLYCSGNGASKPTNVHYGVRADWIEDKATWNTYDGINPWTTPGGDYDAIVISSLFATPGTWLDFDVLSKIKDNFNPQVGFVIVNTWSYGNTYFLSSENSNPALRPKLTITYTSQAPTANAGPDQDVGMQAMVILNGTASTDPNEDPKALIYSWKFIQKPWDSNLTDNSIQPNNTTGYNGADTPIFQADALGDYEIQLTVTNSQGLSSKDFVKITSFYVKAEHPRIWLTPELLNELKARAAANTPEWQALKKRADTIGDYIDNIEENALVYQITGDPKYAQQAITKMDSYLGYDIRRDQGYDARSIPPAMSIGFDWCYDQLTEEQKITYVNQLNAWRDVYLKPDAFGRGNPGNNYFYGYLVAEGLTGLATYGDNPRAREFIDDARNYRFEQLILPYLATAGKGGGWSEGAGYGSASMQFLTKYIEAVKTATGENLYQSDVFFHDIAKYFIYITLPSMSNFYHSGPYGGNPTAIVCDNHDVFMARLMCEFQSEDLGKYIKWWIDNNKEGYEFDWMDWEEFLWYDLDIPAKDYSKDFPLNFYTEGTGEVFSRSDWTENATWVSFKSGGGLYYSDADENTFQIFKHQWLAPDAACYWGACYACSTFMHNGILIDDQGQYRYHSSRGVIEKYDTGQNYVYALGDATAPYNEEKSSPLVESIKREFLFLKPGYILVLDRITTVNPNSTKKWLLHSKNEPVVSDNLVSSTNGEGKIFTKVLLPTNHSINKVALPGEVNSWYIEVQPTTLQKQDILLHILEATDSAQAEMTPVQLVDEGNYYGVIIDDPSLTYNKVLFSKTTAGDYKVTSSIITPRPNITLTKSVDKTQASQGEEITYTITYTNSGSAEAKNITITDTIPVGATYVAGSASGGGVYDPSAGSGQGQITWTIPTLPVNGTGTISFKTQVE